MDSTEKNGQPSMEEILASIRRIIAEEPPGSAPGKSKFIALPPDSLDDHADFELPAIFRSQPAPQEKPAALFGRLTDAIRGASAPGAEPLQMRADDQGAEPVEAPAWAPRNDHAAHQQPGLSSLKPVNGSDLRQREAPSFATNGHDNLNGVQPAPAPVVSNSQPAWKPSGASATPATGDEVKRVMAPFKDTRFRQMAPASSDPLQTPSPQPEPQSFGRSVDFAAIIPGRLDVPGATAPAAESKRAETAAELPPHPWSEAAGEARHTPDGLISMQASPLSPAFEAAHSPSGDEHYPAAAPPTPVGTHAATGTIEDTTAELLRPMLRQWLADNMPRMVEKAMRIEVAESVKTGRKLNGQ